NLIFPADIIIIRGDEKDPLTLYHEYGHWVLANILSNRHKRNTTHFWGANSITVLSKTLRAAEPTAASYVMRMINEGFADFFAIQTWGMASYGRDLHAGPRKKPATCDFSTDA